MRYLLILLALHGCALTPNELRTEGLRSEYSSARQPLDAAGCVTRNTEEYRPLRDVVFLPTQRPGKESGSYEVVVTNGPNHSAIAEIAPRPGGSNITIWLSPYLFWKSLPIEMAKGC